VKVLGPDGNTILLGTREPSAAQPVLAEGESSIRFSLLKEAAALAAARGETNRPCRVRDLNGGPCPSQAVVKLADSLGDKAWVCLAWPRSCHTAAEMTGLSGRRRPANAH